MAENSDGRSGRRKSLFAAAVLYSGGGTFPVRLRNISSDGGLVQGDALPAQGSAVTLSRGVLSVAGRIRWTSQRKAGLKFDRPVEVAQWLLSCAEPGHQRRVDELVAVVRAEIARDIQSSPPGEVASVNVAAGVDIELLEIRALLLEVSAALGEDAEALFRHTDLIQRLDIAAERLSRLIALDERVHGD